MSSSRKLPIGLALGAAAFGGALIWRHLKPARAPELPTRPTHGDKVTAYTLGKAEQAIFKLSAERDGYMRVGMLMRLRGKPVEAAHVTAALEHLQARHPVLRCRAVLIGEAVVLEEGVGPIPVHVKEVAGGEDAADEAWRDLWRDVELLRYKFGDPLAAVYVLPRRSGSDVLFVMEHAVCDGISLSRVCPEFLRVLADVAAGVEVPPAVSKPMEPCIEAASAHRPSLVSKLAGKLGLLRLAASRQTRVADHMPVDLEKPLPGHTSLNYASLTQRETHALVNACRARGLTVGAALGAAQALSAAQLIPTRGDTVDVALACAADTRRLYEPAMDAGGLGYHVSGVKPFSVPVPVSCPDVGTTAWDVAAKFKAVIDSTMSGGLPRVMAPFLGFMYSAMVKEAPALEGAPTTSLSSWGVTGFEPAYGKWTLAFAFPVVNLTLQPFAGSLVTTTCGRLTVLVAGPTPRMEETQMNDLARGMVDVLRTMTGPVTTAE